MARVRETVAVGLTIDECVQTLPALLRRNAGCQRPDQLPTEDRRQLLDCLETIKSFIARICAHEASSRELAALAFDRVYRWLLELAEVAAQTGWIKPSIARWTLESEGIKTRFFLEVLKAVHELRGSGLPLVQSRATLDAFPPADAFPEPSAAMRDLVKDGCDLRGYHPRGSPPEDGELPRLGYELRPNHCAWACDVLFLRGLGFKIREIGDALGVPKSTVNRAMGECTARLAVLEKKVKATETQAAAQIYPQGQRP